MTTAEETTHKASEGQKQPNSMTCMQSYWSVNNNNIKTVIQNELVPTNYIMTQNFRGNVLCSTDVCILLALLYTALAIMFIPYEYKCSHWSEP
jgi:hypothetical protein